MNSKETKERSVSNIVSQAILDQNGGFTLDIIFEKVRKRKAIASSFASDVSVRKYIKKKLADFCESRLIFSDGGYFYPVKSK